MPALKWENPKITPLSRVPHGPSPFNLTKGWAPGDECQPWPSGDGRGLVVSVISDEEMLVLWSRAPRSILRPSDVEYFQNKLFSALRIPKSYLGVAP